MLVVELKSGIMVQSGPDANRQLHDYLVGAATKFPKVDHDDMVDAGVHGLRYLERLDVQVVPEESYEEAENDIVDGL